MSFRDILVFLDGGDASEGRLQLATKIARDHGACLSAVFLQKGQATGSRPRFAPPWLGMVTGPPTSGAIVTSQISEPADIAEQQFRDCLRSLKVEGDWHPLSRADTGELITLAQIWSSSARLNPTLVRRRPGDRRRSSAVAARC